MTAELGAKQKSLYKADYLQWIETTVEKLRISDYSNVDWENLIEEIAEYGAQRAQELKEQSCRSSDALAQRAVSTRT